MLALALLLLISTQILLAQSEDEKAIKCKCDSVMAPLFYFHFLPAYIPCGGNHICLMIRLGWLEVRADKKWGFSSAVINKMLRKQNAKWFDSTGIAADIDHCSAGNATGRGSVQETDAKAVKDHEALLGDDDRPVEEVAALEAVKAQPIDDEVLEAKTVSFMRCLKGALKTKLCDGCLDKYWNKFKILNENRLAIQDIFSELGTYSL